MVKEHEYFAQRLLQDFRGHALQPEAWHAVRIQSLAPEATSRLIAIKRKARAS